MNCFIVILYGFIDILILIVLLLYRIGFIEILILIVFVVISLVLLIYLFFIVIFYLLLKKFGVIWVFFEFDYVCTRFFFV